MGVIPTTFPDAGEPFFGTESAVGLGVTVWTLPASGVTRYSLLINDDQLRPPDNIAKLARTDQ